MTAQSRCIIDTPAVPQWRQEYGTGPNFIAIEKLRQQHHAGVENWPRELSRPIIKQWSDTWAAMPKPALGSLQTLRDVVQWADAIKRELSSLQLEMVSGDVELCELAERCAQLCRDYPESHFFILRRIGLPPPEGPRMTAEGVFRRLQCVRWWRRSLRRHFGQAVENAMRARGHVRKGRAAYCTDWTLRRRTSQKARLRNMLQEAVATNEAGQQFSLFELAEKSVSNPALRRAELMTRISGFERIAQDCGHVALFGTLTAPSCYHAQHHNGGENELFKAAGRPTVRAAQQWLRKMWARARAKLARLSVKWYGFRIAEPHHDGTPHWHGIFFVDKHNADTLVTVLRGVWLKEHGDERGAAKYRCQFKKINPALGSASGYVAKYVAKNIDGFNVGPDYEAGGDSATTAHRVDAWASTHRIRQFQQIGGAPVGVWRECRRVSDAGDMAAIQDAVHCADEGDWAGFCKAAQGIELWKEQTGECNQYREVKAPSVIGVQSGAAQVRTRVHEWSVQWGGKCSSDSRLVGMSAITGDGPSGFLSGGSAASSAMQSLAGLKSVSKSESDRSSAPAGLPPLGPVSITVRGGVGFQIESRTGPANAAATLGTVPTPQPRGDGLLVYEHAGKWRVHRAISISKQFQKPPDRIGFTYDGKPFCHVGPAWKS